MEEFLKQLNLQFIDGYRYRRRLSGGEMAAVAVYTRTPDATSLKDPAPNQIVVKFLIAPRWDRELETFRREAETLMMLRKHEFSQTIVKGLTTVRESKEYPVYYFFLEYVEGMTLRTMFEQDPPPWDYRKALDYLRKIATALLPATAAAEVHRDLHAGNIMIVPPGPVPPGGLFEADPGVRILDFGTSRNWLSGLREHWQEDRFRHCGAVSAWSPEFIEDPSQVDCKHDIWALGNLFLRMLTGEHAFQADNFKNYHHIVTTGQYNQDSIAELPQEVQRLIAGMFAVSPRARLSLGGVRKIADDILEHNLGKWLEERPALQELYFMVEGDIWTCPLCNATGNPGAGSRCRSCRRYVDEFKSPF